MGCPFVCGGARILLPFTGEGGPCFSKGRMRGWNSIAPPVTPGLEPGIHVGPLCVDGRVRPGHDGKSMPYAILTAPLCIRTLSE